MVPLTQNAVVTLVLLNRFSRTLFKLLFSTNHNVDVSFQAGFRSQSKSVALLLIVCLLSLFVDVRFHAGFRAQSKCVSLKLRQCLLSWTKAEEKTMLTLRYSLNTFSAPHTSMTFELPPKFNFGYLSSRGGKYTPWWFGFILGGPTVELHLSTKRASETGLG